MSVTGGNLTPAAPPYEMQNCPACQSYSPRHEECWKFGNIKTRCACYGATDARVEFHNVLRTRMLMERLLEHLGVTV